ncbi:MAG: tRNA1(Val) (adenine(37)-N6)-methyltransferase [Bacteroidales bacterium]
MSNSYFQFKQFTVHQEKCAMKVGTDGVLLGAWCDVTNKKRVLDIGTGTGLIALMIAQRNQDAMIEALDIDTEACLQAAENFISSPWKDRLSVLHADFTKFASSASDRYDLIVSNPPYFENSLKNNCNKRTQARHTDTLPFETLIGSARSLLQPDGCLALVYPSIANERILSLACQNNLICVRQTKIKGSANALPKRYLAEFRISNENNSNSSQSPLTPNELIVEHERHQYTAEFIALTRSFYLKIPD